jgi:hypothetical protein
MRQCQALFVVVFDIRHIGNLAAIIDRHAIQARPHVSDDATR